MCKALFSTPRFRLAHLRMFRLRWLPSRLPHPAYVNEAEYACVHDHIRCLADQHDGSDHGDTLLDLARSCDTLSDAAAEVARTIRSLL